MICFTSSLIRQLYHFATDFDHVLLQLVGTDIENSQFEYSVSYRHLTFMIDTDNWIIRTVDEKLWKIWFIIRVYSMCNCRFTRKSELQSLNCYIGYFNKICRIPCVNTHIQSLKVWLKSILLWLKYSIFSRGLFLLAHPVHCV